MPLSGVLERFFNYWDALPKVANGMLPTKFDMLPTDLHGAMPRMTLLKRVSRYQVNVSLIRTASNQTWHAPFVGMNSFDLTAPNMRENSAKLYEAILDRPAGTLLTEQMKDEGGKQRWVKSLYLPLADTSGNSTYIAGCSVYENRASYANINDRLLPNHEQVMSVAFIDIGAGIPDVLFDPVEIKPPTTQPNQQWWSRFIPGSGKAHRINMVPTRKADEGRWLVDPSGLDGEPTHNIRH